MDYSHENTPLLVELELKFALVYFDYVLINQGFCCKIKEKKKRGFMFMAKRKTSTKKKRTISPEHLAKMQEGRRRKQEIAKHGDRAAGLREVEKRLRKNGCDI